MVYLRKAADKRHKKRSGAALVEFALVAPIFFMFIFAIVEFGRLVMVQQAVANAAREGCRLACLSTTTSAADAETAVRAFLANSVPNAGNPATVRVAVAPNTITSAAASGMPVSVTVDVNFSDITWAPGNFLGMINDPIIRGAASGNRE